MKKYRTIRKIGYCDPLELSHDVWESEQSLNGSVYASCHLKIENEIAHYEGEDDEGTKWEKKTIYLHYTNYNFEKEIDAMIQALTDIKEDVKKEFREIKKEVVKKKGKKKVKKKVKKRLSK